MPLREIDHLNTSSDNVPQESENAPEAEASWINDPDASARRINQMTSLANERELKRLKKGKKGKKAQPEWLKQARVALTELEESNGKPA